MNAEKMFWNCKFSSKILTWRSFQSNVHMKWVAHMSNNISFISVRMNRNQIFAERKEAIPHIPFVSDTSYSSLKCVFSFFKRDRPSLRGSLIKRYLDIVSNDVGNVKTYEVIEWCIFISDVDRDVSPAHCHSFSREFFGVITRNLYYRGLRFL